MRLLPKFICILIGVIFMPFQVISKQKTELKLRKNAPVLNKLHKGINIDTARVDNGVWPKIQHDAAHFEAAARAGCDSVRVFLPFHADYESTNNRLKMLSPISWQS